MQHISYRGEDVGVRNTSHDACKKHIEEESKLHCNDVGMGRDVQNDEELRKAKECD